MLEADLDDHSLCIMDYMARKEYSESNFLEVWILPRQSEEKDNADHQYIIRCINLVQMQQCNQ